MAIDWLHILDVRRAAANCRSDVFGDWHRDPWDWPELEWVAGSNPDLLVQRLNGSSAGRLSPVDVPKENFVLRPAVVFEPLDRLEYEAIVDQVSVKLIGDLPDWVYGWRLRREDPRPGRYADRSDEWQLYRHHLSALAEQFPCALITDVVSCFASIDVSRVVDLVERRAGRNAVTKRLGAILQDWDRTEGRSGLPQRSNASSVLANMYLRPVDDVLSHFGRQRVVLEGVDRTVAATRWMDDIWLFAKDPGYLRSAQMEIQEVLAGLGLQISAGKTQVVEGDRLVDMADEIEHSAVDGALHQWPQDTEPLQELVEELTQSPETASATAIRFATVRIRDHSLHDLDRPFVPIADRMPHGAASLARMFRDTGRWRELDSWYKRYARSHWGRVEWAVAQLGTMFPSAEDGQQPVVEALTSVLERRSSLPLFCVAVQRLAAWDAQDARAIFRDLAPRSADPHERRALALASLNCGEDPGWARKILSEFEENVSTRAMLDARDFQPISPKRDFAGDEEH